VQNPDLKVTKTHTGIFRQGDTGKQYTITVSNQGDGPTDGSAVTVTEDPPAGLTVTDLSGAGWTCQMSSLTCSRSDVLAAGDAYRDITVTVDVGAHAAANVDTSATVGGGGCATNPCDTTHDPTVIEQQSASISGNVFNDKTGHPGLQAWTVYADLNDNGQKDPGEPSATTDANGGYTISGLDARTYKIREITKDGWTCSSPASCSYTRTLASDGSSTGNDFGNWRPGSISGMVYRNVSGHPPLQNWTVYLDLNDNGSKDAGEPSATTDANGGYTIANVAPGAYAAREVVPSGWNCTVPAACKHDVTMQSESASTGNDFGNIQPVEPASLAGTVYNDLNADGTRQARRAGPAGLEGVHRRERQREAGQRRPAGPDRRRRRLLLHRDRAGHVQGVRGLSRGRLALLRAQPVLVRHHLRRGRPRDGQGLR